jgi:hypothetical protein
VPRPCAPCLSRALARQPEQPRVCRRALTRTPAGRRHGERALNQRVRSQRPQTSRGSRRRTRASKRGRRRKSAQTAPRTNPACSVRRRECPDALVHDGARKTCMHMRVLGSARWSTGSTWAPWWGPQAGVKRARDDAQKFPPLNHCQPRGVPKTARLAAGQHLGLPHFSSRAVPGSFPQMADAHGVRGVVTRQCSCP